MSLVFNNYLDMEYKDGSDDTLRRLTDEFGRHKLSDNSTILTEDTDSFIIGQRVWVGGTKPGSIAYIGETLFAPGDWAGIVLDQPIGKNDGSVAGTRYFQCEPKKGVFSRLTRLTRYPLNDIDTSVVDGTPVNGSRRSPISPTGSSSPLKSPHSLTMSNTSLTSAHVDFKLGDRVIIKSSQGSKIGTLRFMGSTDFAAGEWCGVELDEPRGKNDGSVGGKRYFDCRANFGLFAPISKVSKSPSNRKPVACVIHSGSGIPPSGFRRAHSKESLTSNTSITSAASGVRRVRLGVTSLTTPQRASPKPPSAPLPTRTALQEVLTEKQQHIEQLLKERDLERAEIARAASQADEAEQKYATLKQEYEFYKSDAEKKLQEHITILNELSNQRSILLANLEDEKRKNEDLQFKFEEAAIAKTDLENKNTAASTTNEENIFRMKELEAQLVQERTRIEVLEGDSNKLFEAEEHLVRVKEENEALKYEIEVAAKKIQSLEIEGVSNKDLVTSHKKELEDLQFVIKQKDEIIEKIKTDIKSISDQYEQSRINFTNEIEEQKAKYNTTNAESIELKLVLEKLKTEFDQAKNQFHEKTATLEKTIICAKESEEKLNKEIEKLKMNLSAKIIDIENSNDLINKKDEEIKHLLYQLDFKNNIESQNVELSKFKNDATEVENNLRKELEESKSTVKLKINEIEEINKSLKDIINKKEDEVKNAHETIQNYTENIEQLNAIIIHLKEDNIKHNEELQEHLSQQLKEVELKNTDLNKSVSEKEEALTKSSREISRLEDVLKKKNEETKEILDQNNEEITNLRLNIGDFERKLKSSEERSVELLEQKTKLEKEVQDLLGSSGDFSNKLNEMSKELQVKDKNLENIKNDFTIKLQDLERSKEEIQLKYNNYIEKSEKELKDRDEIINNLSRGKDGIKAELDKIINDNKNTIDNLNHRVNEIQIALESKENLLKKSEDEIKQIQENYKVNYEKFQADYNSKNNDLQKRLDNALTENNEIKESLLKKKSEITEIQTKYNEQVELSNKSGSELRTSFEEKIKNLEQLLNEKEKEKIAEAEFAQNLLSEKLKEMENQKIEIKSELDEKIFNLEKANEKYLEENKILLSENKENKQHFEKSLIENTTFIEELKNKIIQLENACAEKDLNMVKIQNEFNLKEIKLNEQLNKNSDNLETNLKEFEIRVNNLKQEKLELSTSITEKLQEINMWEKKYNELVEKNNKDGNILKNIFEEEKTLLVQQVNSLNEEIKNINNDKERLHEFKASAQSLSKEKDEKISELQTALHLNKQFVQKLETEKKEILEQKDAFVLTDKEKEQKIIELNSTISQLHMQIQNTNETSYNLNTANNLYVTILQLIQLSEKDKINLIDKMESSTKNQIDTESYTKLCKLIDKIEVYEETNWEEKINQLQREIEMHKNKEQELESKLKRQETQIPRYKADSQKAQDQNKDVNNVKKLNNSNELSLINNNPITNEQLLEEKQFAEGQVAFLNSIIVDMQKKNEEQKARIEILESGYSPAAADELHLFKLTDRQLPPRMYCDICEEFDLHETEDCPQQANEDMPAREKSPKEKPAQRPYCEICEMFGHATEDCQEDQTF